MHYSVMRSSTISRGTHKDIRLPLTVHNAPPAGGGGWRVVVAEEDIHGCWRLKWKEDVRGILMRASAVP